MTRPLKMKTIGLLGGMSNQATSEYYRLINEEVNRRIGGWDIADPAGDAIKHSKLTKEGFLATKAVMSSPYFTDDFKANHGFEMIVPNKQDQLEVDRIIFDEPVRRELYPESKTKYLTICDEMQSRGAEGIILGCTEIFLLIGQSDRPKLPMFDTTSLHVKAIVDMALGSAG